MTYRGKHFDVESAKVWDLPASPPPIGIAVSGPRSCRLAGRQADVMIAVEPRSELAKLFDDAGGAGKPRVGQIALSYDPDPQIAVKRAMDQFRWFTGNWRVNAELPVPASFDAASKTVREEDVSTQMPCGALNWPAGSPDFWSTRPTSLPSCDTMLTRGPRLGNLALTGWCGPNSPM